MKEKEEYLESIQSKLRKCNRRTPPDGFAEQNGRDAERAD